MTATAVPDAAAASALLTAMLDRHLIALSAGTWGQVVRFIPALVTTAGEVDQALGIIEESLAEIAA